MNNEIRMKDEDPELLAQKAEMNAKDGASSFNRTMKDMSNRLGMDVLSQMMFGATKREQMVDASGFMEEVRERAKRDNGRFQTATDPSCVRPMLDVAWPAMLAVFSMSFEVSKPGHRRRGARRFQPHDPPHVRDGHDGDAGRVRAPAR